MRITGGEATRRSNAGLEMSEVADGWAIACQTYVAGPLEVEVPPRRRERVRPHGHAVAEPESLPISCD